MFEPPFLDDRWVEGTRIEELFRSGKLQPPEVFLDVDLSPLIEKPQIHLPSILGLDGKSLRSGLDVRSLLTPGPADVEFVLAQRGGKLSTVLYELGHCEHNTVVFVIEGGLSCRHVFEYQGFNFEHFARVGSLHLEIVPAACDKEIHVDRGSVLLLCTPGDSQELITVDIDPYLEPFRIRRVESSLRPLITGRVLDGHRVCLRNHRQNEVVNGGEHGALSIAVHTPNEKATTSSDIFIAGPSVVQESRLARHTVDVLFA